MRRIALALSLSLPVLVAGQATQTQPTHEQVINQTFANLNGKPDLVITASGTERVGDRVVPFDTTAVWRQTGSGADRTIKLSIRKRTNNVLTNEVRADGSTVYTYDFLNRTYSATAYHQIKDARNLNARDAAYHTRLLGTLSRVVSSTGPDSYIVRLIQDALGDPAGTTQVMGASAPLYYRSWMPGRQPTRIEENPDLQMGPMTYRDPVVPPATRTYTIDPTGVTRFYLYDNRPRRSLVFQIKDEDPNVTTDDTLLNIFFGEFLQSGGRNRLMEWTLSISYPAVNPADTTYDAQFAPYTDMRGWRPLANPRAPRG